MKEENYKKAKEDIDKILILNNNIDKIANLKSLILIYKTSSTSDLTVLFTKTEYLNKYLKLQDDFKLKILSLLAYQKKELQKNIDNY